MLGLTQALCIKLIFNARHVAIRPSSLPVHSLLHLWRATTHNRRANVNKKDSALGYRTSMSMHGERYCTLSLGPHQKDWAVYMCKGFDGKGRGRGAMDKAPPRSDAG